MRQVNRKRSVTRKRLGTRKLSRKYKLSGGDLQMTEVITPAELRTYLTSDSRNLDYNFTSKPTESPLTQFMNMDNENEKVIWTFNDVKKSSINILLTNYGKILYMIPSQYENGYGSGTLQLEKNNYWIQTEDLPPIKILLKDIRGIDVKWSNQRNELDRRDMDSIFKNLSAYLTYLKINRRRRFETV